MSIRFSSHVAIEDSARTQIVDGLNELLAGTLDLASQVKQAHWNVRGEQFFARHTMFDELYARLVASADQVAERVGQLGGYATGTVRLAAAASQLNEHDLEAIQGRQHVQSLTERYGELDGLVRSQIRKIEAIGEPVTADLYTELLRGLELDMWFLESHLVKSTEPSERVPAKKKASEKVAAS